jgi:transcriptional regulator with XRE-family HTH domain
MTQQGSRLSRAAIFEGDRALRRTSARFGDEFRQVRLGAGVSQAAVARAIGVGRSVICRMEQGDPAVSPRIRARAAVVVGADFRFAVYGRSGPLIHDAAHARIVEALLGLLHPRWKVRLESPVPGPGRRSTDVRLDTGSTVILIEVETHVRALEGIVRELAEKRAAVAALETDRVVRALLVLPWTRHHRALVGTHPAIVGAVFPTGHDRLLSALKDPDVAWPGDGILWLDPQGRLGPVSGRESTSLRE